MNKCISTQMDDMTVVPPLCVECGLNFRDTVFKDWSHFFPFSSMFMVDLLLVAYYRNRIWTQRYTELNRK